MSEHILDSDLALVYNEILAATCPSDVFGSPVKQQSQSQQERAIEQTFQSLLQVVEPDQYTRVIDANAAVDAREILTKLYEQALAAFEIGTTLVDFTVRETKYQVKKLMMYSTNSVLYRATATIGGASEEVVIHIATNKEGSSILKTEAENLRSFQTAHSNHPITRVTNTLPTLVDSFNVEGRQINILPYYHRYRSVEEILNYFHHVLPVGHAAWIARRLLAFPLTAAMAGVAHKAMTFDHLLVHPVTHEPIYTSWGNSVPAKTADLRNLDMKETFLRVKELFTDERFLFTGDTPLEIRTFLNHQCVQDELIDGVAALNEFTELIYKTLGKKYRPLTLN